MIIFFIRLCNNIVNQISQVNNWASFQALGENFTEIKSVMESKINEIKSNENLSNTFHFELVEMNKFIVKTEEEIEI